MVGSQPVNTGITLSYREDTVNVNKLWATHLFYVVHNLFARLLDKSRSEGLIHISISKMLSNYLC